MNTHLQQPEKPAQAALSWYRLGYSGKAGEWIVGMGGRSGWNIDNKRGNEGKWPHW